MLNYFLIFVFSGLAGLVQVKAQEVGATLNLVFPTPNQHLLSGHLEKFYQPTVSKRLISGMYGFVRSSEPEPARYFNLFHEGVDIRPMQVDARRNPVDPVMAAAGGKVVYVNAKASQSNYGLYLMIKHQTHEGNFYTTYGHLAAIFVKVGQAVEAGEVIGKMGWSGNVGTRDRAHLHFEVGFLINQHFQDWYEKIGKGFETRPTPNEHGNFSGLNFLGVDPAPLLIGTAKGKGITVLGIFQGLKPMYRVRIPANSDFFDWQKRFPAQVEAGLTLPLPTSWEVECASTGMPLFFWRSDILCLKPELLWFDESLTRQESFTRGIIQTAQGQRSLSHHGLKWFSQLTWSP